MWKRKLVGGAQERMKLPRAQPLAQLSFCLYFGHTLSLPSFAFISPFLMPVPSSVNVSSSVYLTSHSQWPSVHQSARNRNSGVAFGSSLRLCHGILSHTLDNGFPTHLFQHASQPPPSPPGHHASWVSADLSLPLCLPVCLKSRLHTADKMTFLELFTALKIQTQ